MRKLFAKGWMLCAALALVMGQGAMAQNYAPKYELIDKAAYTTNDLMRGDWAKPGADGQKGTIIMVTGDRGKPTDNYAFITMQVATEVSNISFWYPEQDINDVKSYPPTILYGEQGYWGNEYCNVRHVTFINSDHWGGGNYWSIHEFYAGNIAETTSIGTIDMDDVVSTAFYTADGRKISSISQIDNGVLIVVKTDSKGKRQTKKYIIQ